MNLRARVLAVLDRFSWVGPLAVRLSLGAVFLGTGWGKLHNLGQVTSLFTELGIPSQPGKRRWFRGSSSSAARSSWSASSPGSRRCR